MDYPKFVEVNGKRYKINTDFRVAIKCNQIAMDDNIKDYERALAVIYTLYGDEGLNDCENHNKLLELAQVYLSCNKELDEVPEGKADMDYAEDMDYIEASFMSDYHIDLETTEMHWWKFNNLINGLSNSEMGNCCILNTIRNIRNYDLSKVKDEKERRKIAKLQQQFALKTNDKKFTKEQQEAIEKFSKLAGL